MTCKCKCPDVDDLEVPEEIESPGLVCDKTPLTEEKTKGGNDDEWDQPYHKAVRNGFLWVMGFQVIVVIELALLIWKT